MKKLRSLSVLVIPIIVLVLFTCCQPIDNSGSGSFTYDGTTYPLTNGALENWGRGDFDVLLASSGLNAVLWEGIGNVVWFDLVAPSTIGAPGTYDWAGTDGFTLWDGGISKSRGQGYTLDNTSLDIAVKSIMISAYTSVLVNPVCLREAAVLLCKLIKTKN